MPNVEIDTNELHARNEMWQAFLTAWPYERVMAMTLEEYSNPGSKDSFSYWIEFGTTNLGSIKGGDSSKFGIYRRKSAPKGERPHIVHGEAYSWKRNLGETEQLAFQEIKSQIIHVIDAVKRGDLDVIQDSPLPNTIKWKTAFLYQDQSSPKVLAIFKEAVFQRACKSSDITIAQANNELLACKPEGVDAASYTYHVWNLNQPPEDEIIEQLKEHLTLDILNGMNNDKLELLHTLTELANESSLDIYPTTKTDQLKIGRQGKPVEGKASATFAIINLSKRSIRVAIGERRENLTLALIEELGKTIPEFVEDNPVERVGYWPCDYVISEGIAELSNVEKNTIQEVINPVNKILYGPPGTGKTYHLQQIEKQYISTPEVQDESQWLQEKLDPLNWMQVLVLCLLDLDKQVKVKQLVEHSYFQCKTKLNNRDKNLTNTAWAALQSFSILESTTVDYKSHSEPAVFDKTADAYWFIVDEKRELIEELVDLYQEIKQGPKADQFIKRYSMTTFHQSYGYEEFIEGLKAETDENGNISYSVAPGVFLKLCQRAEADSNHRYAIFIDEINRGNISKIFGELISLIELDKRAGCENAMSIKLTYSGKEFSVPANVDIIGTMNTADRSLAMMDTALRRRFDFVEMMPEPELLEDCYVKGINLEQLLIVLNQRIEILYDREHMLGHAFFMPVKKTLEEQGEDQAFEALELVFKNKIIPLLEEYFFEDWEKIRLVLADNQKSKNPGLQFVKRVELKNTDLNSLFGSNHQLDQYGQTQVRYTLAKPESSVWSTPNSYLGVYNVSGIETHNEVNDSDAVSNQ
ncbi:McrB family protein [Vibrio sp. 10N.222.54.B12]|uniref:McrB family protein n=1 Tax=Vibrio sp. 10N.222.54.B12 TaxID=3229636 RepID=UPI0035539B20